MKRNFEKIRDILFQIEASEQKGNGTVSDSDIFGPDTHRSYTERQRNLRSLHDAELFEGIDLQGEFMIHGTSSRGRDLTDILRNEQVFNTAVEVTQHIDGITMTLFADLAHAVMTQLIEQKANIQIPMPGSQRVSIRRTWITITREPQNTDVY